MTDFLGAAYPWIKSFHVISVIAWMAGLFYLPRLFVYHVEQVGHGGATDEMFQIMERRLYRAIMNPSMIATWVFGLMMVFTPGIIDWAQPWVWMKAAGIVGMTWFHHWLGRRRKEFLAGPSPWTGRQFRLMNEVPTILMVLIVVAVIARPFL
jgi:putative membrane protein